MTADLEPLLAKLATGCSLDEKEAYIAFDIVMSGSATPSQIGALCMGMRIRGETVEEIAGAAKSMRHKALTIESPEGAVDTAGTGGAPKVFNVSTAAAIIAAAAGAKVAKHGNRSRTGRGSAEVLAELGVNVDAGREVQQRCLQEAGVAFCFAIHHHPAAMHAIPVRKALGFPTNMFTVLFAMGRLPGWIAQWKEMCEDPKTRIGRPRQIYTGANVREYVPIHKR